MRARPDPDTWSALEYAAHLRDALRFYEDRIRRTLSEDRPQLEPYGFTLLVNTSGTGVTNVNVRADSTAPGLLPSPVARNCSS